MYTKWATNGALQQFRRWILSIFQLHSSVGHAMWLVPKAAVWTRLIFSILACVLWDSQLLLARGFVLCSFLTSLKTDGVDTECSTYILPRVLCSRCLDINVELTTSPFKKAVKVKQSSIQFREL